MLELSKTLDFVVLFAVAAVLGGVGGLVFELLQSRYGQTGFVESPGRRRGRYRDWGVWGNVLIGAVAAMAALWVFPPQTETIIPAAGGDATTTTQYAIVDLVGLSLIIGSAGSSFLSSLQARVMARLKEQEAVTTREVADRQLESIKQEVKALPKQADMAQQAAPDILAGVINRIEQAQVAVAATEPRDTEGG